MLTEVVQVPRPETPIDPPQPPSDLDWAELALRVRESVLERLQRRSELVLDEQLRATMHSVIDRAADTLALQLHDTLSQMIRDIVARAVTEELTRVHAEVARRRRDPA